MKAIQTASPSTGASWGMPCTSVASEFRKMVATTATTKRRVIRLAMARWRRKSRCRAPIMRPRANSIEVKRLPPLQISPAMLTTPRRPELWRTPSSALVSAERESAGKKPNTASRKWVRTAGVLVIRPRMASRPRMSGNMLRKAVNASPEA